MRIFIDTEFTDFKSMYLISIGMVTETGTEFYAETTFPLDACSDFVKEVVLPQLGRKPDRIFDCQRLGRELMQWLESVRPTGGYLEICFDFYADGDLLVVALGQPFPSWCQLRNVWSQIDDRVVALYFRQTGNADHHALHDACANRFAYREAVIKEAP